MLRWTLKMFYSYRIFHTWYYFKQGCDIVYINSIHWKWNFHVKLHSYFKTYQLLLWLISQLKSNILNALSAKNWHDKRLFDLRNLKTSQLVGDTEIRKKHCLKIQKGTIFWYYRGRYFPYNGSLYCFKFWHTF